jgi:hypothetical protein
MRRFFQVFWAALATAILVPVVGEWFVSLVRERGAYEHPSAHVESVMTWLASVVYHPAYLVAAGTVLGLALGMWMDTALRRRDLRRNVKPDLEIVYEKSDSRFARSASERDYTRYYIGVRNNTSRTLFSPSVRAHEGNFVSSTLSIAAMAYAGHSVREPVIFEAESIHPGALEIVELFGLPNDKERFGHPREDFVLEARALDTPNSIVRFEYDPDSKVKIKKLPG